MNEDNNQQSKDTAPLSQTPTNEANTSNAEQSPQINTDIQADAASQQVQVNDLGRAKRKKMLILLFVLILIFIIGAVVTGALIVNRNNSKTSKKQATNVTSNAPAAAAEVVIKGGAFVPATLQVKKGQIVVWKNEDDAQHQVAADPYPTNTSLPDLGRGEVLNKGDTFSYQYDQTGTFTYHDNLNPYTIKGTVIVKE